MLRQQQHQMVKIRGPSEVSMSLPDDPHWGQEGGERRGKPLLYCAVCYGSIITILG